MTTHTFTAQSVFLTFPIFKKNVSQLEGLNRRFPQAWMNREQYPYYKHRLFKSISLFDEYSKNLAYCLWEYSLSNPELRTELKSLMIRNEASIYRKYQKETGAVLPPEFYDLVTTEALGDKPSLNQLVNFAANAFLVELCDWDYHESIKDKVYSLWNEKVTNFLKDEQPKNLWGTSFHGIEDKMKNPSDLRHIQSLLKDYERELGQSLSKYLSELFFSTEFNSNSLSQTISCSCPTLLGIKIIGLSKNPLTQSETLEIFGQASYTYERFKDKETLSDAIGFIQDMMKKDFPTLDKDNINLGKLTEYTKTYQLPDTLDEDLLQFYNNYLPFFGAFYLLAKHHEANRDYFFRIKTNADTISLNQLEKQLTAAKKENKELKQAIKHHQQLMAKTRQDVQQQFQERLKKGQEDLILTHQQLNRMTQEKETLEDEVARLKERLLELSAKEELNDIADEHLSIEDVDLNQPNILILGGHPNQVAKLKERLPECKFCEPDKLYQDDFFKKIDYAFTLVGYMNHGMSYKLNKVRPNIPKRVISATNPDRIINEMKEAYLKDLAK